MSDSTDAPRYTFEQFADIRRYQGTLSFSPDGAHIAYSSDASGQFNLWRQPTAGGTPIQLTDDPERAVREVAWSPDGASILYTADHHGDEFHELVLIPATGGEAKALTDQPSVQHYLAAEPWSPDSTRIAYAGNDRAPTDQDMLVRDLRDGSIQRVLAGDALYFPAAWSPDGRTLTATDEISNSESRVYLVPIDGGEARLLTPAEGEVRFYPGPWAPDGSGFYLLTDEGREFLGLAFYDLASGEYRWLEAPEWDITIVEASRDGRFVAWVVNEDGYFRLRARDLATGEELPLPELPDGVISTLRVSPDGGKIGVLLSQPQHPTEIFIVDLASKSLTQLTQSACGGVAETDLVRPELIRFPTHDGREIPAFLYRPRGEGPFPVVLAIHGGPEAQELPTYAYSGLYQYWVNRGIGVLAPNVRGSTGYGKSYQKLIHRDWGGDELRDFDAAARYLQSLPWVDPARIGVFGGSFGGFATLSCVSRLPDYWAAAVDLVGPSNLVTFAKAVPPTWRRMMAKWVGDPETEEEFLLSRSPITYVDQIQAPLFVIQGANDPRVVQGESDQIVERLRERGVAVRYDVYPDEGHGFTKRENTLRALRDTAEFMAEHLGAAG